MKFWEGAHHAFAATYRINRAGDAAAGLAISEKMRAQITGLDAAQKNVQDGISAIDMSNMNAAHDLADTAAADTSKMTITYNKDTTTFTMKYTVDDAATEVVENVKLDGVPADGTEETVTFSNGLKLTVNSKLTAAITETALAGTKNSDGGLNLQIGDC